MRALAVCAAVTVLAVAALPANAHDKSFDSRVTIKHPIEPRYQGRVFSESPRCVASRTVRFFYSTGEHIFNIETNSEGRWSFDFSGTTGYYAKVTREVRGGPGHRHICKGDRSPTIS
jgi:hypothetical protein